MKKVVMNKKWDSKINSPLGLLMLAIALLLAVGLISVMKPVRIDLTENNLYTLSPGTLSLLAKLEGQPVEFDFYYSDTVTKNIPSLRVYAKRVREMLQEYELQSKGAIKLNIIDP